jgi:hypothetical protein
MPQATIAFGMGIDKAGEPRLEFRRGAVAF